MFVRDHCEILLRFSENIEQNVNFYRLESGNERVRGGTSVQSIPVFFRIKVRFRLIVKLNLVFLMYIVVLYLHEK